jgi:hypothetical protein
MKQPPSADVPSVAPVPLKSIMRTPFVAQKRALTASKIQGWWKKSHKINVSEQQKVLAAKKPPEASTQVTTEVATNAIATGESTTPPVATEAESVEPIVKEAKDIMKTKSVTEDPIAPEVSPAPIAPDRVIPSKADTPTESQNGSARTKKRVAAKSIISATIDLALIDQLIQEVPFHSNRLSKVPRKASSRPPAEVSIPTSMHTPQPPIQPPPVATKSTKAAVVKAKRKANDVSDPAKKKRKPKVRSGTAAEPTEEEVQPTERASAPVKGSAKTAPKPKVKSSRNAETDEDLRRKRNPQVWEGVPDDPVAFDIDWSTGWVKRGFERTSGARKSFIDYYWYTPERKYKLRSLKEVERFVNFYHANDQDEEVAHRLLRSK